MTEPLVALSIDGAPSYSWLARRCVQSLRRTSTNLDVVVFVSRGAALDVSDLPNIHLIDVDADHHESVYLEKWYRLSRLGAERVVFLDADTICLQPLELLLEKYQVEDIYARQEAGTQRPEEPPGDSAYPPQVQWEIFREQRDLSDMKLPVVNTGVMVFNHGSCRRITRFLDALCEMYTDWSSGRRPYPCTNRHIMEELALSAALGRAGSPTLGQLEPEDAPFFSELAAGARYGGIVLHVWSGLYRTYLQESGNRKDVSDYDFQRRRDVLRRIQASKQTTPRSGLACR